MYYDTKYSPTKNLKPLNFAKGRTFAPKITPTTEVLVVVSAVTASAVTAGTVGGSVATAVEGAVVTAGISLGGWEVESP